MILFQRTRHNVLVQATNLKKYAMFVYEESTGKMLFVNT